MDILLQDTGDGAEVILSGGDLKGDGTLYNAVYLSLFGGDNFSNAFKEYESNGEFEESLNLPITTPNLKTVENKANKSLKWLIDEGIAESVESFAFGNGDNKIEVDITIKEPQKVESSYSIIWRNQKAVLIRK